MVLTVNMITITSHPCGRMKQSTSVLLALCFSIQDSDWEADSPFT